MNITVDRVGRLTDAMVEQSESKNEFTTVVLPRTTSDPTCLIGQKGQASDS